jgi:CspA family cold shock protein
MSSTDAVTSSAGRLIGRVKWFNNKTGYGFITVTDGARAGTDIFVHHSAVQVESQQYKYLVQGEYVEFELSSTPSGNHEFQATNVSGIKGGKLMCETRHEFKVVRNNYRESTSSRENIVTTMVEEPSVTMPTQKSVSRKPRVRGDGPREEKSDKKDWTLVQGKVSGRGRGRPARTVE